MARPTRLKRLFEHASDLDAILLVNDPPDPSFFWATGLHHGGTFEGAACVLGAGAKPTVLCPLLEETTAKKSANRIVLFSGKDGLADAIQEELSGADRVGLDLTRVTVSRYRKLEKLLPKANFVDASEAIGKARAIKDADEVDAIRRACALTDKIADKMETLVEGARTESELAARIVHRLLAQGATTSFEPIIGWGPGSAEPHYSPGAVALKTGPLLVDMGARRSGYCSDITRTYSLGKPTKRLARMHAVVLEALEAGIDAARAGTSGGDVHNAVDAVIARTEFKGRFIHSTGHGLGVEVHDGGRLHPQHDLTLEAGMVFTIEPGVYLPGEAGVRIEDDVLITTRGCEVLTKAKRGLRDLRA